MNEIRQSMYSYKVQEKIVIMRNLRRKRFGKRGGLARNGMGDRLGTYVQLWIAGV